jgi:hypothetical protein
MSILAASVTTQVVLYGQKLINMNIQIKQVTPDDLFLLQRIGKSTFSETFSSENTPEDMTEYLDKEFSIAKLKAELEDPNVQFFFAFFNGRIIGYLKVNSGSSQTELKGENSLEIERIYVLKEFQGKDVGKLLFEKALELATDKNTEFVWLGVWEHNKRAIRFYEKNGFKAFDKHIFKLGNDEQTDIMMKRTLQ